MNNDFLIVNTIAAVLIIGVIWWFYGSKPTVAIPSASAPIIIFVQNGTYNPSLIQIPANTEVRLRFIRHDESSCSSTVVFPDLSYAYNLPLNEAVDVVIPPQADGQISFNCPMGSYSGKLVVAH